MIACCECEAMHLMRPLNTYSAPGFQFRRMVDAGSVMISAIRFARPSSDPPSVGKGEFPAEEAKAATLEMEGREMDTES